MARDRTPPRGNRAAPRGHARRPRRRHRGADAGRRPDDVARYHPAARRLRDRKAEHQISSAQLRRAGGIIHAFATEAQRRGWKAYPDTAGVRIEPPGIKVRISIKERGVHRRGPWEEDVRRYRDYTPFFRERPVPTGPYDEDATGELELSIDVTPGCGFDGRQSRWSDRQSWTLEERLPYLFQEIAMRIVLAERHAIRQRIAAERAAEAAQRAKEERERQWHALMTQARERLIEDHRAAHLRAQADAWHEADRLRAYCAAVAEKHAGPRHRAIPDLGQEPCNLDRPAHRPTDASVRTRAHS